MNLVKNFQTDQRHEMKFIHVFNQLFVIPDFLIHQKSHFTFYDVTITYENPGEVDAGDGRRA